MGQGAEGGCHLPLSIQRANHVQGVRLSSVESGSNFGTKFSGASDQLEEASVTSSHDLREAPCEGLSVRVKPIVVGGIRAR
jgi:hypothetical protein